MKEDEYNYEADLVQEEKTIQELQSKIDNVKSLIEDIRQCKNGASKKILLTAVRKYLSALTSPHVGAELSR